MNNHINIRHKIGSFNKQIKVEGDKSISIRALLLGSQAYGKTFIEYVYLNKFRENKSQITISGEQNLKKIINDNKPVIFVSGHFHFYINDSLHRHDNFEIHGDPRQ